MATIVVAALYGNHRGMALTRFYPLPVLGDSVIVAFFRTIFPSDVFGTSGVGTYDGNKPR